MRYRSIIEKRQHVQFPEFKPERIYMREFRKHDGLPADLAHWQRAIDTILDGVETDLPIYIMIDAGFVPAGKAQRREGIHIDGYWNPGIIAHGGERIGGGHEGSPGHRSSPSGGTHGSHYRGHNSEQAPSGGHGSAPARHFSDAESWRQADFTAPEGLLLASSVSAARGFVGDFEGMIGEGGDCSSIDVSGLAVMPMGAGIVYAGNVTALHESLPVASDCLRQLVRLNVPGWTP